MLDFVIHELIPPPPPAQEEEEASADYDDSSPTMDPYFQYVRDKWRRGQQVWIQVTVNYPLHGYTMTTLTCRVPNSDGVGTPTRITSSTLWGPK
jgi:hypothetical protein